MPERQTYVRNSIRAGCCLALALLMLLCSPHPPLSLQASPGKEDARPPSHIVVCIIHGDGGYLFHDTDGNEHRADETALAGARKVAEQNSQAEVFIFHEITRRHSLLFFPRRDGKFSYYRNGKLIAKESYWRD